LFVESAAGPSVVLSQRAWKSLAKPQRRVLEQHALPILCGVETIEHIGGGGIRCMLAEIFLPSTCTPSLS
ncbi:MAG TPA: arginine deiminase-related protein, partial [Steroidobacteraceae bacterium]